MTPHRPTTLSLLARCCPAALDHYDSGAARDLRVFGVGTAAHEALHALHDGRDLGTLRVGLIAGAVNGEAIHPDDVAAGFDLARRWVERNPLDHGHAEVMYAYDEAWQPTTWEAARFRTRIDLVTIATEGDEDTGEQRVVVVRDYKSSWQADDSELDTIQRRAQAVSVWLAHPDVDAIRLEVANLRTLRVYDRTIWLDEEGVALLTSWRDELDQLMAAADVRPRVARVGPGCLKCEYGAACKPARSWLEVSGYTDPGEVMQAHVAASAVAKATDKILRALAEGGPVVTDHGTAQYVEGTTAEPKPGATSAAIRSYLMAAGVEVVDSVATVLDGIPAAGSTWLRAVAKALRPGRQREAREALEAEWIADESSRKFKVGGAE